MSEGIGPAEPVAMLRGYLGAHPGNPVSLLRDPHRMESLAADLAPGDPALRNALVAVSRENAERLFVAPAPPGPDAFWSLVVQLEQRQGIAGPAAVRAVVLLAAAYLGPEAAAFASSRPQAGQVGQTRHVGEGAAVAKKSHWPAILAVGAGAIALIWGATALGGQEEPSSTTSPGVTTVSSPSPASPSPPSPTLNQPTPQVTFSPAALADALNPDLVTKGSCSDGGSTAEEVVVGCQANPSIGTPPAQLWVYQHPTREAMDRVFLGHLGDGGPDAHKCPTAPNSEWNYGGTNVASGQMACVTRDGTRWVIWTHWDNNTTIWAGDEKRAHTELFEWWKKAPRPFRA